MQYVNQPKPQPPVYVPPQGPIMTRPEPQYIVLPDGRRVLVQR